MYAELVRKTCTKCSVEQSISEFYKNKRYADGHVTWCKSCKKKHSRDNPQIIQKWSEENREASNAIKQKYAANNPEKVKASKARWAKANGKKMLAKTRRYQAAKRNATPKWLTTRQIAEMEQFYINCPQGYEVDHVVPLQGKQVKGLHVPWNLQYMLPRPNRKKSNKY
jgi:hypothetical protein